MTRILIRILILLLILLSFNTCKEFEFNNPVDVEVEISPPTATEINFLSDTLAVITWNHKEISKYSFLIEISEDGQNYIELGIAEKTDRYNANYDFKVSVNYYFRIAAFKDKNISSYETIQIPIPLGAPTDLSVNFPDDTKAVLNWEDNSTIETGFDIESSKDSSNFTLIKTVPANTTSTVREGPSLTTTKYYFRAKAKSSNNQSGYSNVAQGTPFILCGDKVYYEGEPNSGGSGAYYNTVQIGEQCWLKENLDVGTMIESNSSGFLQTDNGVIEKYCYNNDPANCETYGGLYEWPEAMQYTTTEGVQAICPDGWHIPSRTEFQELEDYVDNKSAALIDESETLDFTPTVTQNETGFSALFAGYRYVTNGYFRSLGSIARFWSSSESSSSYAHYMGLGNNSSTVTLYRHTKDYGFSVRCVQD